MNRLASPEPITFLITLPSARVRRETKGDAVLFLFERRVVGSPPSMKEFTRRGPRIVSPARTTPSAAPSPRGRVPTVVAIFLATIRLPALEIAWPRPNSASPPHATIGLAWLELQNVA